MPESPNKLLNNDHGNYVSATFTGHIYDTTLDIYFAEARFYDADNRTWLAADPIKDGGNWYQYCNSNPTTYWDPTGLWGTVTGTKQAKLSGSDSIDWNRVGTGVIKVAGGVVIVVVGIGAICVTGGTALTAVIGMLEGTVAVGSTMVTVGTLTSGIAATAFGVSDLSEAGFGNENTYYDVEMLVTGGAAAGTYVFQTYDLGGQIKAAGSQNYGNGNVRVSGGSTSRETIGIPNSGQGFSENGYYPKLGERTFNGYVKNNVSPNAELKLITNSPEFNNHNGEIGGQFKLFGVNPHAGISPHVHQAYRNVNPEGYIFGGTYGGKTGPGLIDYPTAKDVSQLYQYLENGKYR